MAFKQRPSTYKISVAPTGRARCRGRCRQLISKGAVRVETCAFVRPGRATVFVRCAECVDKATAAAILRVYRSVEHVPVGEGVSLSDALSVRSRILIRAV